MSAALIVQPSAGPLIGSVRPPGDKSISHRAAILGGLADGQTEIEGFLEAEDTLATLGAMQALGARVERDRTRVRIRGGRLRAPRDALDLGNSGTGIRLLTGALCGHPDLIDERLVLVGDASLSRRPMQRIVTPLAMMGARIETTEGCAPLAVRPRALTGIEYACPVASAQVKSALLLAGLFAGGTTRVLEPGPSRDHTERMLPSFGQPVHCAGQRVELTGRGALSASRVAVPGDLSSAAFAMAAAVLVRESRVRVESVGINPTRNGLLRILEAMGVPSLGPDVSSAPGHASGEPVVDFDVRSPESLTGIDIPAEWVPLAIDEFPLVMALAAAASGKTSITGAAELRVKESDRLAVMVRQLQRLGVEAEERSDGAVIHGGRVRGGRVDAEGDHRIAMSLAVLALVAEAPVIIDGAEWIRTSYPGFVDAMTGIGASLAWR